MEISDEKKTSWWIWENIVSVVGWEGLGLAEGYDLSSGPLRSEDFKSLYTMEVFPHFVGQQCMPRLLHRV